jgi:hypothetical protein
MGYLVGLKLREVWVDDDSGECVHAGPEYLLSRGYSHRDTAIREALSVVAPLACGHKWSNGDRGCFDRAMWLGGFTERPGFIRRRLVEFSKETFRQRGPFTALAALTDALNQRSYLTGNEAEKIMKHAIATECL